MSERYYCSINGTSINLLLVKDSTVDPSLASRCGSVAVLPISEENAQAMDNDTKTLLNALYEGFDLRWIARDDDKCKSCTDSGGQCGRNWTNMQFTCYCPDKPYPLLCPQSKSGPFVAVGVVVSIAIVFVVACAIAMMLKCRKKSKEMIHVEENNTTEVWGGEAKFKFSEISEATEDFNERYRIGAGGFGSVYKATFVTGQVLAVKQLIDTSELSEPVKQWSFINEVRTLTKVRHRNIIKLHGFCYKARRMYLMYDYIAKGSLGNILRSQDGANELTWERRVNIVQGLANALKYLHHDCFPPIVHRDISINNILLDDVFEPKLSDFGTAKLMSLDTSNWTSAVGSCGYTAPEMAQTVRVTPKCDVYSFGVVALEIIMGKHPSDLLYSLLSLSMNDHQDLVMSDLLDDRLSPPVRKLVDELMLVIKVALICTSTTPESRPTMYQVTKAFSSRSESSSVELFEVA